MTLKRIKKQASKEYLAGWDAGMNGANDTNCNFTLFTTQTQTDEWDRGNRDALLAKGKKKYEAA